MNDPAAIGSALDRSPGIGVSVSSIGDEPVMVVSRNAPPASVQVAAYDAVSAAPPQCGGKKRTTAAIPSAISLN